MGISFQMTYEDPQAGIEKQAMYPQTLAQQILMDEALGDIPANTLTNYLERGRVIVSNVQPTSDNSKELWLNDNDPTQPVLMYYCGPTGYIPVVGGGGGGEPASYIKNASVTGPTGGPTGSTLVLTKKDGSSVTFTKLPYLQNASVSGNKLTLVGYNASGVQVTTEFQPSGGGGGINQAFIIKDSDDGLPSEADRVKLWVDTNEDNGGLKYWNGSTWKHVPVAFT